MVMTVRFNPYERRPSSGRSNGARMYLSRGLSRELLEKAEMGVPPDGPFHVRLVLLDERTLFIYPDPRGLPLFRVRRGVVCSGYNVALRPLMFPKGTYKAVVEVREIGGGKIMGIVVRESDMVKGGHEVRHRKSRP